ncbi:DNA polymerase III subunit beta [Pediococcus ethanolidurans]|uniref:DNA polymerase III subunit beta n=1 Tax=Pediococcus ethanolidurans TaxID=319653 RepID=UPI001C1EFC8B|nr:DNA polymerase III subunit beta [Pediococcus ethanolidurans]MBU7554887.1 DNA polymerase III subunit beta [Pediococcus ethanolidurans]MBU7563656.1 DNA polymerase III subunit beta [Pediococcus ethanolidurans]MCT4398883.1 DNA polymerase III subunit beta [Pediococcus ethanolidurans]MCV3315159.1 DNA polymerase III subunit beta [Pediococcus ethanolidurans]MCV3320875.1 DNA polymerase III subunit beta [Pediococcus ethanolidurans]
MKFTVKRAAFIKKLNDVQRAISSKTTIPILTGLKLDVKSDQIILTGSDADISIETVLDAKNEDNGLSITDPGKIVLPAHFFSDIVKRLPEESMTVEITEGFQTEISSGAAEFTINGLDANNYPRLPELDGNDQIQLSGNVFKQLISQTVLAVSTQESRPILTGVHFSIDGDQFVAVATDSHRLSQRQIRLPQENTGKYDVIIPGKSLVELSRMIGEENPDVIMRISENQVLFTLGDTAFYSRLLEGNYPDTSRLIPKEATTTLEFDAPALLAAIERASLLSHESRNNVVKLAITTADKKIVISGNSPDVGNVEEQLDAKVVEGEDLEISFNPDYMKDALRSFGQTEIQVSFTSALRPFTLVPTEDQENFIQLITPVRTF